MFDLVIRDARLVGPDGIVPGSLAIRDGRIAAVAGPAEPVPALSEIRAAGRWVLPGLVDAHVHLREPGLEHKEDFGSGTRAAAAGGVTTVMVMPTDDPWTATPASFAEKRALGEAKAHVDFALQAAAGPRGEWVAALAELGAVSFELFLAGGHPDFLIEQDDDLLHLLGRLREVGAVAGVTTGSARIVGAATAEQKARGVPDIRAFTASRPPVSEAVGVARACAFAAEAGSRLHVRQVSCGAGVAMLRRFRDTGLVSAEVTPHNLLLTEEDAERLHPLSTVLPPLRTPADIGALRDALRAGAIDIVATDHAPHLKAEKERGRTDVWASPSGLPGLQTFLPAMLHLADLGAISLPEIVRTCAARPAELFGLYPRKGALLPGSDADLVIVDPEKRTVMGEGEQYSRAGFTPFEGLVANGRIDYVLLRGAVVLRDGRIASGPTGRFVRPSPR